MNLMIVIDDLFRGGTEQTLKSRLCYLPDDWEVAIIVLYAKGSIGQDLENKGFYVKCMQMASEGYIRTIQNVRKEVKEFNPDIILFMRDISRGLLPFFITGKAKKVLFWDNAVIYKSFRHYCFEFLQVKIAKIDFLCSSEAIAENLKKHYKSEKVTVIPNCYNEHLFKFKDIFAMPEKKIRRILSVGSMRYEKNHSDKIEIAKILKDHDIEFTLDIVGRGDFSSIKELIDNYKLEEQVNVTGEISNLHQKIHDYDLFLMTSHTEGCPVALLEALASGLPCVVYPFKSLEYLNNINEMIFNIKSKTPVEAADTIIKIINQKSYKLKQHLNNASNFVLKNFSSEHNSLKWFSYLSF